MKFSSVLTAIGAGLWIVAASAAPTSAVQRCGWFDNPSPGNAWLYDRDGDWTIGMQGGHEAQGAWPTFTPKQWVRTGAGSYGYGCACLTMQTRPESSEVDRIVSARARPLSACRTDAAIRSKEPAHPLK